jgi:hypothetical protein
MSVGVTSYFTVATGESTSTVDFLASYVRALPDLPMHAATHPPGPVLYYRSLIDASRATPRLTGAIVRGLAAVGVQPDRLAASGERHSPTVAVAALAGGFGTVAAAALTGWAVAAMVALAGADALAAAQVAVLWAFCPAAVFFSPMFDQIVMFLVAACAACACASALARRRWIVVAAGLGSGVSAGLALFSSFGAAPMLAAAGILTIVLTRGRGASWRRVIAVAALAAAGAALVFGGPILAGYDEIAAARVALRVHFDRFMAGRSRWVWLRFNLLDFSIFLGWPLIAWGAVHLARGGTMSTRWPFRARPLWTMIAVVVALDLADVTRGEVGRLWMPLMPLFYAAAAVAAIDLAARADSSNDAGRRTASLERLLVAVSLAAATITLGLYWAP